MIIECSLGLKDPVALLAGGSFVHLRIKSLSELLLNSVSKVTKVISIKNTFLFLNDVIKFVFLSFQDRFSSDLLYVGALYRVLGVLLVLGLLLPLGYMLLNGVHLAHILLNLFLVLEDLLLHFLS